MLNKYSEHFLLNSQTAIVYTIEQINYFVPEDEAQLTCAEIGDGNINYVFKVSHTNGKSIVLKQADKLLRSSGRPLDIRRSLIEAEILKIQASLSPEFVPTVYNYDETMAVLAMEDISAYKNLRTELMAGQMFPNLAQEISLFLVETLLPTTDLVVDAAVKKERVQLFTNIELCAISETLVFLEPYDDYKKQNHFAPSNEAYVTQKVYQNSLLKGEVAYLRNNFMNNAQALVHGDLHTGSIFANQSGTKVIDPEFAFYGPMGYDIGNVIGNLVFNLVYHVVEHHENEAMITWLQETIATIYDLVATGLQEKYVTLETNSLYQEANFRNAYLAEIMHDTLGYAGTELIRRTIGDSKVAEVKAIGSDRIAATERVLLEIGSGLIINRAQIGSGSALINLINGCLVF